MRGLGYILITIGVIYLIYAFNMDVSVRTSVDYIPGLGTVGGQDVVNLDMMSRRQNHLIVACLITFIGAMMAIFGKSEAETATDSTGGNDRGFTFDFEGERDLSSDRYRLWLADRYEIRRNEVFDRFVVGENTYDTLDDALAHADVLESERLAEIEAAEERREIEREEREAARLQSIEDSEAQWQEIKPKFIAGGIIIAAIVAGLIYMSRETPEERADRLAQEQAEIEAELAGVRGAIGADLPEDVTKVAETSDLIWCREDAEIGMTTMEYSFYTSDSLDEVKSLFQEKLGNGSEPEQFSLANWAWQDDEKLVTIHQYDDATNSPITVCVTTSED